MGIVYRLTAPCGKKYIGITSRALELRMRDHAKQVKGGSCYAIHSAIRKYGIEKFKIEIVGRGDMEKCKKAEQILIRVENTKGDGGYNMTDGGDGVCGMSPSEETREKLRQANIGRVWPREVVERRRASNIGKKRSTAFSARMSEVHKGKNVSDETREKMRKANRARLENQEWREWLLTIGSNPTSETRAKMRAAKLGKKLSEETRQKMREAHQRRKEAIHAY